jgi:hypothetical protein
MQIEYNLENEFYLLLNGDIPFIFEDLDYSTFEGDKLLKMRRSHLKSLGITYFAVGTSSFPDDNKKEVKAKAAKKPSKDTSTNKPKQGVKDTSTNKPNRERERRTAKDTSICDPVLAHLERYKKLKPEERLWYKVSNHIDLAFHEAMKIGGAVKHITRCSEQYSDRKQFKVTDRLYQNIKSAKKIQGKLFKSVN